MVLKIVHTRFNKYLGVIFNEFADFSIHLNSLAASGARVLCSIYILVLSKFICHAGNH